MRQNYRDGHSIGEISKRYSVPTSTVKDIVYWKLYRNAGGPNTFTRKKPLKGEVFMSKKDDYRKAVAKRIILERQLLGHKPR